MKFFSDPEVAEEVEEALDVVRREVNVGLEGPAEIFDIATAETTVRARRVVERAVRDAIKREFKKKRAAEAGWPEVTDCDRLDAVQASLLGDGILLRQYFSCCATCVASDLRGLREVELAADRNPRAVVYFFPQDLDDRLFEHPGGQLVLRSARFEAADDPAAIQALVEKALRDNGLKFEINGGQVKLSIIWRRRSASRYRV